MLNRLECSSGFLAPYYQLCVSSIVSVENFAVGVVKEEPSQGRDDYLEAVSPERSLPADEPFSDAEQEEEAEEEEEEEEQEEEARTEGSVPEEEAEEEEEDEGEDEEMEEGRGSSCVRVGVIRHPKWTPGAGVWVLRPLVGQVLFGTEKQLE